MTTEQQADTDRPVEPWEEAGARRGSGARECAWAWWVAGAAVVVVYAVYFSVMIGRHTAMPFFDQTNYVGKVYEITDAWHRCGSVWGCLNPGLYLRAGHQTRPPLLMIPPALFWGDGATPHEIALMWLGMRLAALVAAVWLLARRVGTARFVPAALAGVLGSAFLLQVHPHLYLMDHAFTCFALLVFVLALEATEEPTVWRALWASAGALTLLLIKPQALMLLLPMFAVLTMRGALWLRDIAQGKREELKRWLTIAAVYVVLGGIVIALGVSPYGAAIKEQYKLGSRGYWRSEIPWNVKARVLTLLVPLWVAALLAAAWVRRRTAGVSRWALAMTAATVGWWAVWTVLLTYAFDPRIITGAMAISMTMLLAMACRGRVLGVTGVLIGFGLFGLNMSIAAGGVLRPGIAQGVAPLTGPLAKRQRPLAEVGLRPLVKEFVAAVRAEEGPGRQPLIQTTFMEEFIEYSALDLTRRLEREGGARFSPLPWGADRFVLAELLGQRWFVTIRPAHQHLGPDALASHDALDRLVTATGSPLHPLMERRATARIRRVATAMPQQWMLDSNEAEQPVLEQEVTLWHLRRPVTREELAAALRWIEPRFRGTEGQALILEQLAELTAKP